ncbi:hypothetical protein QR680_012182 [Steinernema hermaphroditum]|uniref:SNARE-complex protein Syntaxin-18 N-terminal domain-containing protein n=1 Tax=Steinernema hermaphroditum TaxID=289476 RepID=A0AA39I3W4_9BILA|nr:hypothetical protein QR680_012182 [Steinernema hermaphroditum]
MAVHDNTTLFRAHTKTILLKRETKRKKGIVERIEEAPKRSEPSLNYKRYSKKCVQVASTITELRNLVLENRASYVLTMSGNDSFGAVPLRQMMTDEDRNGLDHETDRAMRVCSVHISNLQECIGNDVTLRADDEAPHLLSVCTLLDVYLKSICQIVTDMRTVRLIKTQSRQKLSRLSTLVELYESPKMKRESPKCIETRSSKTPKLTEKEHCVMERMNISCQGEPQPEKELSESERVQFAMENEQLRQRFQTTNVEVEKIEKQFTELQHLQKSFSEKIMNQEREISQLNEVAAKTVDEIKDGNDFIRQAIKNGASRRVIFMFCLLVLAFTLLFLDWYNL